MLLIEIQADISCVESGLDKTQSITQAIEANLENRDSLISRWKI